MNPDREVPMKYKTVLWVAVCLVLVPTLAPAEITQLVIQSSNLYDGGTSYGNVGQYEDLKGYAIGELDPSNSLNAGIANLNNAPLNSRSRIQVQSGCRNLEAG